MSRDLKKVLRAVEDAGFTVVINKKGHSEVCDAGGVKVTTFSGTPSDHRSWLNVLALLKRRGFKWPRR